MEWLNQHSARDIRAALAEINLKLDKLLKGQQTIMADLTALTAQVTQNTTVEGSAIQLIQNIAAQLAASSSDQAAVDALAAKLNTSATALAAAITANTPAAPPTATT